MQTQGVTFMLSLSVDLSLSTYLPLSLFCMSCSSDFPSVITFYKFFGKFRSASDIFFLLFSFENVLFCVIFEIYGYRFSGG